jgi:hypothetical protein
MSRNISNRGSRRDCHVTRGKEAQIASRQALCPVHLSAFNLSRHSPNLRPEFAKRTSFVAKQAGGGQGHPIPRVYRNLLNEPTVARSFVRSAVSPQRVNIFDVSTCNKQLEAPPLQDNQLRPPPNRPPHDLSIPAAYKVPAHLQKFLRTGTRDFHASKMLIRASFFARLKIISGPWYLVCTANRDFFGSQHSRQIVSLFRGGVRLRSEWQFTRTSRFLRFHVTASSEYRRLIRS